MTDIRNTGVIYNGMYNQIKEIQKENEALAGELAIAYFERILTGEIETENPIIKALIAAVEPVIEKDIDQYNSKVKGKKEKEKEQLKCIYRLYRKGKTQGEIAKELNLKQGTISKKLSKVKNEYPDIVSEIEMELTAVPGMTYEQSAPTSSIEGTSPQFYF